MGLDNTSMRVSFVRRTLLNDASTCVLAVTGIVVGSRVYAVARETQGRVSFAF